MKKILLLILISSHLFLLAQVDRSVKPSPGKIPNLQLPLIQKASLPNGLKIAFVEHSELPLVQIQLVINRGTVNENIEGIANLTANMLDEGTKNRSAIQISDDINFLGSSFNISASKDATTASLLTLKENLFSSLDIFTDVLFKPTFPPNEWTRILNQHIASLQQQKDLPQVVASNIFNKKVFGDNNPYGNPNSGTIQSVNKITINDLKNYYSQNYIPNEATIIIVGDIKFNEAVNLVKKYFSDWKSGGSTILAENKSTLDNSNKIYFIDKPQAAQSEIYVGHVGVKRNTDDFFKLNLLNTILGGQFSSRINMNLRESKGYTYGARSSFTMYKNNGSFYFNSPVKSAVTDSSIIEIMNEFKKAVNENVSEKEIELAKNTIIRSLPQSFETPSQIANQISNLVIYNLPDNYYNTIIQKYNNISISDLRETAKKYLFPDNVIIVVVGDLLLNKNKIADLKIGNIQILNSDGAEIK